MATKLEREGAEVSFILSSVVTNTKLNYTHCGKIEYKKEAETWELFLSVNDFEVVHGIYLTLKHLPDKCFTAKIINSENLPDPKDDGSFLLKIL